VFEVNGTKVFGHSKVDDYVLACLLIPHVHEGQTDIYHRLLRDGAGGNFNRRIGSQASDV